MIKQIDLAQMPRKELEEYAMQACSEVDILKQKVEQYEAQLRLMAKKKYGRSSEQTNIDEQQLSIFNEAEESADLQKPEPKIDQVKRPAKKSKGEKQAKIKNIPKQITEYTLQEEQTVCPVCGNQMAVMTRKVRKEIEIIPPKVTVHEHVAYVYVCRACEKQAESTPILQAPSPAPLLPGSVLSPSLAAYILCRKFENRDTLYKMEEDFRAAGLELRRQTLSNWTLRIAELYGKLLYEWLKKHLTEDTYLHADETPLQVLHEPGKSAQSKSYMWLFATNHTAAHPIILYHYADSRSGEIPKAFLKSYHGILQCDGYDGYNKVEDVLRMGCLAHVRRKFIDAEKSLKKIEINSRNTPERKGIRWCDILFRMDSRAKGICLTERKEWKETYIRKKMEAFFRWAEKEAAMAGPANTALSKALHYLLHERKYLENYFCDARIEFSNNLAERSIRPFVMGRKNWLFCNTPRGAGSSAVWYSLVVTAKENGIKPYAYLEYVLDQLRGKTKEDLTGEELDALLPWSDQLPESCKMKGNEEEIFREE